MIHGTAHMITSSIATASDGAPTGQAKRALAQALGDAERAAAKLDPLLGTASPSQPAQSVVGAAPFSVKVHH